MVFYLIPKKAEIAQIQNNLRKNKKKKIFLGCLSLAWLVVVHQPISAMLVTTEIFQTFLETGDGYFINLLQGRLSSMRSHHQ